MSVELKQYSPRAEEDKQLSQKEKDVMNESYDNPAYQTGSEQSENVVVVDDKGQVSSQVFQILTSQTTIVISDVRMKV